MYVTVQICCSCCACPFRDTPRQCLSLCGTHELSLFSSTTSALFRLAPQARRSSSRLRHGHSQAHHLSSTSAPIVTAPQCLGHPRPWLSSSPRSGDSSSVSHLARASANQIRPWTSTLVIHPCASQLPCGSLPFCRRRPWSRDLAKHPNGRRHFQSFVGGGHPVDQLSLEAPREVRMADLDLAPGVRGSHVRALQTGVSPFV
ncbi:hypothetical protein C8Q78DRAFT_1059060 [Trametes maxima]|nr:hypothetical protein C8Q78DRAFT_1059060 [Trametes maxima]